jgi:ketosteroid isomerase-like protein
MNVKFLLICLIVTVLVGCNNQATQPQQKILPIVGDTIAVPKYIPVSKDLYDEIAHMDSVLFDAFNARDIEKLATVFSEDLEFYHDKGGLTDYQQTMDNFKSLFERNQHTGLKRVLMEGSMEVYPIKDFGAVQLGRHRFCHQENGKDDCGTFQFVHTWQKKDGQWKVARIISFDH